MKMIHALVSSCGSCPFLDVVSEPIETKSHSTFDEGWFCLHKARRSYVLTLKHAEGSGLREWLVTRHGEPFPPDCPLPETGRGFRPAGVRALDLQPVVKG